MISLEIMSRGALLLRQLKVFKGLKVLLLLFVVARPLCVSSQKPLLIQDHASGSL